MTITTNKSAARSFTTAAAMSDYYNEISDDTAAIIEAMEAEYEEYMWALELDAAIEAAWRQDMADLEAARKYGEETGYWDCYSDLFKSIYGVRPRW